jgi:hypothetical protein
MIKFVLKILNLSGRSLQIRSKHRTTSASTQKCGTSFELSEFQPVTIKQTNNMRVNEAQIHIVNHDHRTSVTWLDTHIIVRGSKRSNLRKRNHKLKMQLFVLTKNLTKQLVLVAKSIFKFGDSQRKTIGGSVITYIRVRVRDVPRRLAHKAKASKVARLTLGPLILLGAEGVIAGEVEVVEGCTRSGHHLLELLLLLVPEAVLLLALALVAGVVPIVVVVLVGGVELLPLGAIDDEVGGVTALEAAPRRPPPLLAEPVQRAELPRQQGDLVVGDALVLLIRSCTQGRQGKLQNR